MRTHSQRRQWQRTHGSVLMSAAVAAAVLGTMVVGFLAWVTNEYILARRSHQWTQALCMAEAGVEVGYDELQYRYSTTGGGFASVNGWTNQSAGTYSKTVTGLTSATGAVVGDFTVTVSQVGNAHPLIMGVGTCLAPPHRTAIVRAVKVSLAGSGKLKGAVISKSKIALKGTNFDTDSFDSTDPAKSTNGLYDSNKRQTNGDIFTLSTDPLAIDMAGANIHGVLNTAPGGEVTMANKTLVGPTLDKKLQASTVAEAEANGWISDDFAADIPNASLPTDFNPAGSYGDVKNSGTTTITAGDWNVGNIDLKTGSTIVIQGGTVRLHVTGSTSVAGQGSIIISPGARLEVYADGAMSLAGNGVINQTGLAVNNQFYGLPTSTYWDISGNGAWIGVVYAPQADLKLSGGGNFVGSVVANTITASGSTLFHYDESLGKSGGGGSGYKVGSWQPLVYRSGAWVIETN